MDSIPQKNIFLAPMAGVTTLPFRKIAKQMGASLVFTEMVSAKSIIYDNKETFNMLKVEQCEKPVAVQLFGSEPHIISEAIKKIEQYDFASIDINMGCPAPKITKNGEGSALLKNPKLIEQILISAVKTSKKPVSIKIRKLSDFEKTLEIVQIAENTGVSYVTIHGRTKNQFYSGVADWDVIKNIKSKTNIKIIANGDIKNVFDAKKIIEHTNCDGIMIGRASQGNPFIFREINAYLNQNILIDKPTVTEKIDTAIMQTIMTIDLMGEYTGIREMRKTLSDYFKGMQFSKTLRERMFKIQNKDELISFLESIKQEG